MSGLEGCMAPFREEIRKLVDQEQELTKDFGLI